MGLNETDKEVKPKKGKKYSGMFVRPGTYSKYIDEFLDKDIEVAKITIDEEDIIKKGVDSVPVDTLYPGLLTNVEKRDTENVRVVKDGDEVFLVRTDLID